MNDPKSPPAANDPTPEYQPPPPPAPDTPAWAEPPRARRSRKVGLTVGAIVVVLALIPTLLYLTPAGRDVAASLSLPGSSAIDLRTGAVFLQSNDTAGNVVLAYGRAEDGRLTEVGRYPTGGTGSGSFEDSAGGLVLGDSTGEVLPTGKKSVNADMLFALNSGSDSISVFTVGRDGLDLADTVPSGGQKPVSITVNNGLAYVLNSGEFEDRLFLYDGRMPVGATENCTTGQLPSIVGFTVDSAGKLAEVPGSRRLLSGVADSGCAQVQFTPDGKNIIVSERVGGKDGTQPPGGFAKGAIVTYPVRADGTLGDMTPIAPVGNGPFGFTFANDHTMLTTEQNGGFVNTDGGFVASYTMDESGTLTGNGGPVKTSTTDPCWIAVSGADQNGDQMAYVSGFTGTVASFKMDGEGHLSLLHRAASSASGSDDKGDHVPLGATDIGMSRDSRFVYVLNSDLGMLLGFKADGNGSLSMVGQYQAFNVASVYEGGAYAPFGLAAN